ncbi:hypothetical protein NKH18_15995 [Streptomyces sp. M10(2022)]
MKGLMNAMSRNPSAATGYFDPNTTDNLKYFLEDRDWPGGAVEDEMPDELKQTSARTEFGATLEAAATGREPAARCTPSPPTTTARRPRSSSGSSRNTAARTRRRTRAPCPCPCARAWAT